MNKQPLSSYDSIYVPPHHLLCSIITIPNYTSYVIGSKLCETRLLMPLLLSIGEAAQVVLWRTTKLNSSRRSCKSPSFSSLLLKTTTFLKKALIVKLSCSRISVPPSFSCIFVNHVHVFRDE
ncbi:hypothetical protein ACFX1R_015163 [Malus domestica]